MQTDSGMFLFLTVFTGLITLMTLGMRGSVETACWEGFNTSLSINQSTEFYEDTQLRVNSCVDENWSDWYYGLFIAPLGLTLILVAKKLAIF